MNKFNLAYLIADMVDINIVELSENFLTDPIKFEHVMSKNGKYITIKYCEQYDYEDDIADVLIVALIKYIKEKDLDISAKYETTLEDIIDLDTLEVFLHIVESLGCIFIELP